MQLIISYNLLSEGQLDPLTGDGLGSRIVTVMLIKVKERNFQHREVMDDWLALPLGCLRVHQGIDQHWRTSNFQHWKRFKTGISRHRPQENGRH
jgi:hypothetical protein